MTVIKSMILPVLFVLFLVAGTAVESLAIDDHTKQGQTKQQTERLLKVYN